MTISRGQRDSIVGAASEATIDAIHDEMTIATQQAREFAAEHCPDATGIIYEPDDQGDWHLAVAVECPTDGAACPANIAVHDDHHVAYGPSLFADHMHCTTGLTTAPDISTTAWRLTLADIEPTRCEPQP